MLIFVLLSLFAVPALADEPDPNEEFYNIDLPFIEDDFDSFDEYAQAINMYLNPEDYTTPIGTIDSGDLGTDNVTVRLYAGPYANWSTTESFSASADLAYTKTFATSSLQSNLKNMGASTAKKPATVFNSYFNPLFGYTVTYALNEDETISDSTINFDLNFSGDTAYTVNGYYASLVYNDSSFSSLSTSNSTSSWIKNLVGSMPSLVGAGGAYNVSSNGTTYYIGAMHNTLTFIGITTSDEQIVLGTYEDTTGGKYSIKIPEDIEVASLVFDMDYYYASDGFPDSTFWSGYNFPYMFKAGFSGTISVEGPSVSSLIGNIIAWLKSILSAIQALPQQIADKVIDGIKALFVPSIDDLQPKFDEFKSVAYAKLGFVYQVATDFVTLLQELFYATVEPTTTLTIPRIALPWDLAPNGEMVILEETTFDVFPEGLEVLRNLCKTITSMVLVLALYRSVLEAFEKFFKE